MELEALILFEEYNGYETKGSLLKRTLKTPAVPLLNLAETQPKHKPCVSLEIMCENVRSSCHAECPWIQEWINTSWYINTVGC